MKTSLIVLARKQPLLLLCLMTSPSQSACFFVFVCEIVSVSLSHSLSVFGSLCRWIFLSLYFYLRLSFSTALCWSHNRYLSFSLPLSVYVLSLSLPLSLSTSLYLSFRGLGLGLGLGLCLFLWLTFKLNQTRCRSEKNLKFYIILLPMFLIKLYSALFISVLKRLPHIKFYYHQLLNESYYFLVLINNQSQCFTLRR